MAHKTKKSPIRVKNPTSEHHVVRVHPGQDFIVFLSDSYGAVEMDVRSNLFRLAHKAKLGEFNVFRFEQIAPEALQDWSELSRTYLGSVAILTEKTQHLSNLSVVLESDISNVLTVVNPDNAKVKLEITDTLEVVVFDPKLELEDRWSYRINPDKILALQLQQVQGEIMRPNLIRHNKSLRRTADRISYEWHFWFEFDWASKMAAGELTPGTYKAGNIVFQVGGEDFFQSELELLLWVPKNKPVHVPTERKVKTEIIRSATVVVDRSELDNAYSRETHPDDYEDWTTSVGRGDLTEGWPTKYTGKHGKTYKSTPSVREVTLNEVERANLETGCTVLFFENSKLVKVS